MLLYSYIAMTFLWFSTYKAIKKKYNCSIKVSRNITSFLHALGVSLITGLYLTKSTKLIYIVEPYSFGFFIYDTYHCLFNKYSSNKTESIGLTTHHLIALFIVIYSSHPVYGNFVYLILFLGELSNLPGYITYYLKHSNKKNKWYCNFILLYQTLWYSLIRVPLCGYIAYQNRHIFLENYYFNIIWLVYYMGLYWSYKLWKQVYYIFR